MSSVNKRKRSMQSDLESSDLLDNSLFDSSTNRTIVNKTQNKRKKGHKFKTANNYRAKCSWTKCGFRRNV